MTLKIRSGYNRENVNYLEVLAAAEAAGAQMITLHPRTCMQLFNGKADWSQIADLKAHAHIPVIGNGDIFSVDDALTMMEHLVLCHMDSISVLRMRRLSGKVPSRDVNFASSAEWKDSKFLINFSKER